MSDSVYQEIFKACRPFYDIRRESFDFWCLRSLPALLDDGLQANATANHEPIASSFLPPPVQLRVSRDVLLNPMDIFIQNLDILTSIVFLCVCLPETRATGELRRRASTQDPSGFSHEEKNHEASHHSKSYPY
jgi:hypothetical protein